VEVEDRDSAWLSPERREGSEPCVVLLPPGETLESVCDEERWVWLQDVSQGTSETVFRLEPAETFDYDKFYEESDGVWEVVPSALWHEWNDE
jgi:hypothetical protein